MIYPAEGELDPNSEDFHDIVRMSRSIGRNPAFVQGGGGNISIKLDHRLMLIKASGVFLKNVETSSGLSLVDYFSLKDYITFGCQQSCDEFDKALRKFELVPYGSDEPVKCSIETGLHALLGKAVIHSHSVYSNILTCSNNGRDLVKRLFSNAIWVEYFTPGRDLAVAVKRAIEDIDTRNSILIFLENHGILFPQRQPQSASSIILVSIKRSQMLCLAYPSLNQKIS
ncbi:MAG: class II aldolase/adducin family protein [Bdellovibrionales bacterium]|nr:class II aldolase/adducin family protein [Bdellovibrionales bacterium]